MKTEETVVAEQVAPAVVEGAVAEINATDAKKVEAAAAKALAKFTQKVEDMQETSLVPLSKIKIGENFSRHFSEDVTDFAKEIKGDGGLLQPVTVRPEFDDAGVMTGSFMLVAGFRRMRALKVLHAEYPADGWNKVPVYLRSDIDSTWAPIANLRENLGRKDPSPIEFAMSVKALAEERKLEIPGKDVKKLADELRVSPAYITERMLLLQLPVPTQKRIHEGVMAAKTAFVVADLPASVREEAIKKAEKIQGAKDAVKEEKEAAKQAKAAEKEAKKAEKAAKGAGKTAGKNDQKPTPEMEKNAKAMREEIAAKKAAAAKEKGVGKIEVSSVREAAKEILAENPDMDSLEKAMVEKVAAVSGRTLAMFDEEVLELVSGANPVLDTLVSSLRDWAKGTLSSEDMGNTLLTMFEGAGTEEVEIHTAG